MTTPFYRQSSAKAAVIELIRRSNPELPEEINENTVNISNPVTITGPGVNAQVTLTSNGTNPDIVGEVTVSYQRVSLANIVFVSGAINVGVRKIGNQPAGLNLSTDTGFYGVRTRQRIAARMGIFWDNPSDFTLSNTSLLAGNSNDTGITLTAAANNLIYTGSCIFTLYLNNGREVDAVFPTSRVINKAIEFAPNSDIFYRLLAIKPTEELFDASVAILGSESLPASGVVLNASHQPFFNILNSLAGTNLRADIDRSVVGSFGLGQQTIRRVAPTNSNVIVRNSNDVNEATDINAELRSILSNKWNRLIIIQGNFTGWQKTTLIIPIVEN